MMSDAEVMKDADVLIVDDAPANLDLLRNILEPAGCHIFFATSGEMALQVASKSNPDIILLDVMMPGIDGFETCRRLKGIDKLAETPVVFVTAKTDVTDLVKGFSRWKAETGRIRHQASPRPQAVEGLEAPARPVSVLDLDYSLPNTR